MSLLGPGLSPRLKGFPNRKPPALLPFSPGLAGAEWGWFWRHPNLHLSCPLWERGGPISDFSKNRFTGTLTQFAWSAAQAGTSILTEDNAQASAGLSFGSQAALQSSVITYFFVFEVPTVTGSRYTAVSSKWDASTDGFAVVINDGSDNANIEISDKAQATILFSDNNIVIPNKIHACCITYDVSGNCKIILDGRLVGEGTSLRTIGHGEFVLGNYRQSSTVVSDTFDLYAFAMFDVVLPVPQCQQLTRDPFGPFRTGVRPLFISAAAAASELVPSRYEVQRFYANS